MLALRMARVTNDSCFSSLNNKVERAKLITLAETNAN